MDQLTDSIYVTLGSQLRREKSYKTLVGDFLRCDGHPGSPYFYWKLQNLPNKAVRNNILYVYLVIGNSVRWRARVARMDYDIFGLTAEFDDGRVATSRGWILLYDFEKLPKPYEKRKGFQGFRYKQ